MPISFSSEGGNMAPMFEIYFLIGSDKSASEEELMELSSEMGKFNDVVQISSDELNFSFSTQVRDDLSSFIWLSKI